MNTDLKGEMNDRPHPGPLPQERGKRAPSPCVAGASRVSFAFRFEESGVATDRLTLEKPVSANRCSLSSGERVRVRAGVITNFKTTDLKAKVENVVNFTKVIL